MHCSRRAVHRRSFSTWKRWRMAEASRQPGVSCSGEKGRVSTRDGMQQALRSRAVANTPKPPHPAGLTYRFLGRLQLLQPVPQFPGGLMRRSLCGHLQGKWPCVLTMPRGAATSPRAAELAWGWGILGGGGVALTQPRRSSRAWVRKAKGRWRVSANLGAAGSPSMAVARASSASTSTIRSGTCGREHPGYGPKAPGLATGWRSGS